MYSSIHLVLQKCYYLQFLYKDSELHFMSTAVQVLLQQVGSAD